jgi:hypothetical protein
MDEQQRQEFADAIKKAFAKLKKPAKNAARSDNDELRDIVGKNWDEITPNELSDSFMVFYTAAGLHYYLQAYLITAILHSEDVEQPSHIISILSPPPNPVLLKVDFSCEQMKVIVAFFELYRELYPVQESLINSRIHIHEEKTLEQGWEYWSRKLAECH